MRDPWLERHVETCFPKLHQARLDAHLDEGPGDCDEGAIRAELLKRLQDDLGQPLPDELRQLLDEIHALRDAHLPGNRAGAAYREARRQIVRRWNDAWQRARAGRLLPPSLAGCSLQLADLPGIDLSDADLRPLEGLFPPNHTRAVLRRANLRGANLAGNNLAHAQLQRADLGRARLAGAKLSHANLRGADLSHADLTGADLEHADLTGADLKHADLTGAELFQARLDRADLRFTRGLMVNENSVHRTLFTNRAGLMWAVPVYTCFLLQWLVLRLGLMHRTRRLEWPEPEDRWSAMRRSYTGPNFFVSLLFLIAFFAPFLLQAVVLSQVGRAESPLVRAAEAATGQPFASAEMSADEMARLRARLPEEYAAIGEAFGDAARSARESATSAARLRARPDPATVQQAQEAAERAVADLERARQNAAQLRADLGRYVAGRVQERRYRVWQILLGLDGRQYVLSLLLCLLVVYNALKWFLTTTVAPMREVEDRSHVTPAKPEYARLVGLHRVVSWLYWLSAAAGLWTFFDLMRASVYKFW